MLSDSDGEFCGNCIIQFLILGGGRTAISFDSAKSSVAVGFEANPQNQGCQDSVRMAKRCVPPRPHPPHSKTLARPPVPELGLRVRIAVRFWSAVADGERG